METEPKIDLLWKVMGRIDSYMISTHNKAALLLAFNTFVIGGIILKWRDITDMFIVIPIMKIFVPFLLFICAAASIYSIYKLFKVINPYLHSFVQPEKYHSKIFFNHIAQYNTEVEYYNGIKDVNQERLIEDLSYQIYNLSSGAKSKYDYMKQATGAILYFILPSLILILFCKIYVIIYQLSIIL